MSDQEKNLGQIAWTGFYISYPCQEPDGWPLYDKISDAVKGDWESAAQAVAARVRAETAEEIASLRQQLGNQNMHSEVCGVVRETAKELFQGNCAFVIDDISLMAAVANWALLNGIPDELNHEILPKSKAAAAARRDAIEAGKATA